MDKSSEAFRTITEVAENLDLPQHVLRFWETRFTQIKPLKRAGGRRYYRPEDVQLITAIRRLLYDEGFTIRGVQRLLREKGAKAITAGAVATPFGGSNDRTPVAAVGRGEEEQMEAAGELLRTPNGAEFGHVSNGGEASNPNLDRGAIESLLEQLSECRRILDGVLHPRS
jgi:DNA-binding transcriptional MerR regulator